MTPEQFAILHKIAHSQIAARNRDNQESGLTLTLCGACLRPSTDADHEDEDEDDDGEATWVLVVNGIVSSIGGDIKGNAAITSVTTTPASVPMGTALAMFVGPVPADPAPLA